MATLDVSTVAFLDPDGTGGMMASQEGWMGFFRVIMIVAGALVLGGTSRGATASDKATTGTVLLSVLTMDGSPIADARFVVTDTTRTVRTAQTGMARVAVSADWKSTETLARDLVTLDDERYRVASLIKTIPPGREGHLYLYELIPSELSTLTTEQRHQYALNFAGLVAGGRASDAASRELRETAAFLDGYRRMAPDADRELSQPPRQFPKPDADAKPPAPRVRATVVDGYGNPVGGRVVDLLGLRGDGQLEIVGRRRADSTGHVAFADVPAGGPYRLVVDAAGDGLSARTTLFRVDDKDREPARHTLVLRPVERTLSGFLFLEGKPLQGAIVQRLDGTRASLTTTSDAHGYFELAPVQAGTGEVSILLDVDAQKLALLPEVPSGRELLLPMELLLQAPPAR